jgi:hypothetical protein
MSAEESLSETSLSSTTPTRHYKRATVEDARRWAEKYRNRESILKIAKEEEFAPSSISAWLRKIGVEIKQGQHFVKQPPLRYATELIALCSKGSDEVQRFLAARVWGLQFSKSGLEQLEKFCTFVELHGEGIGVKEIARKLMVNRSTVA